MDNPRFVDEEAIPLVQDEDYDDYKTPDTSRVGETAFMEPDATKATSTLRLRQKVKQGKRTAFYRHLNIAGNPDLINLDKFRLTTDLKNERQFSSFTMVINGFLDKTNRRVSCNKNIKG